MSYQGTGAAPGDVLTWDGTSVVWAPGGAGSSTWTEIDTDFQYSTDTSQAVLVGTDTPQSEANGSIAAVGTGSATVRGIITWQHSSTTDGATFMAIKSRGTRGTPTAVASGDVVGRTVFRAYDGSAYFNRASITAQVDGTVVDVGDVIPMAISVFTGRTSALLRTTWASDGAQLHNTDAAAQYEWQQAGVQRMIIQSDGSQVHGVDTGGTFTWQINGTTEMFLNASALFLQTNSIYAGTATTVSEQVGSIAAVSTGSGGPRGLISWQHSTDTNGAFSYANKSRGSRTVPTTVANGDVIGAIIFQGYDGSAYVPRALIGASVDGTVVDAGDVVPMQFVIQTGSTSLVTRSLWSSNGTQAHVADAGANYSWVINGNFYAVLTAGLLDFPTTTDIRTFGTIALGPTPRATAGLIRVAHAPGVAVLMGRNAANSGDVDLVRWHSSQTLEFGGTGATTVTFNADTTVSFLVGGSSAIDISSTKLTSYIGEWQFRGNLTPNINQDQAAGAAGPFLIQAQQPGSANSRGGRLDLWGGQNTGSGAYGNVAIKLGASGTEYMIEATDLGSAGTRRHVAVFFSGILTTTQMPASTGDKTMFFGDCATAPTADAVGGGIMYSEGGAGKWRSSSGTTTAFGPSEPHCQRCGRDFAIEHKNDKYGKQSICIWCLVDALKKNGVSEDEFVIERDADWKEAA